MALPDAQFQALKAQLAQKKAGNVSGGQGLSPEAFASLKDTLRAKKQETAGGLPNFMSSVGKGAYSLGKGAVKTAYDVGRKAGIGLGSEVAQTALSVPELGSRAGQSISKSLGLKAPEKYFGMLTSGLEKTKQKALVEPFQEELSSLSGKAGQVLGDVALLGTPSGEVAKAKDVLTGVKEGLGIEKALANYPKFAKAVDYVAGKTARALPEAGLGTGLGLLQGQSPTEALKTGAGFGVVGAGIEGAGDLFNKIRGGLNENVAKAIGMTGKLTTQQAIEKIPKATRALKFIADHAPDIKVEGIDGVEKQFDPLKADFYETLQAFSQTKKSIYNKYTALAEKAGDDYVRIGKNDFDTLFSKLQDIIDKRGSEFVAKAKQIKGDLIRIFGDKRTGGKTMRYIRPTEFQSYLEDLNTYVKADPRTPSAKVSGEMSEAIREIMDKNITGATGEGYQNLRNAYSDLKSIEQELVNQFKKAARGTKGLSSYVDAYGDLDVVISAISHSPTEFARGIGEKIIAKTFKYLKDPENNLRRAFELLQENKPEAGAMGARFLGRETAQSPALKEKGRPFGEAISKGVGDYVKNPKLGASIEDVSKPPVYKETGNLTTKILKDLEGKTTVSKKYILDATNRGELKQTERDLIRKMLSNEGDTINVKNFADKVKGELLPLESVGDTKPLGDRLTQYENITLPYELRGDVKDYTERIYNSPIKTSAGKTHFSGAPDFASDNYFGHTRIEDMADNKTRRVIEVQSDLYQKGNLEKELGVSKKTPMNIAVRDLPQAKQNIYYDAIDKLQFGNATEKAQAKTIIDELTAEADNLRKAQNPQKLQQYSNPTAHFRMVREEIQKASKDGKTKLQFPTGETAMKIEGLGTQGDGGMMFAYQGFPIEPQQLKVGREIYSEASDEDWVITETLGNGKFRAVPKEIADKTNPEALVSTGRAQGEMFDISGEIDTNNPIYKFYEKDLKKYLSKFGGKQVTDSNGVTWIEVPINKELGKMPVEAFSMIGLGTAKPFAEALKKKQNNNDK